MMIDLRSDTITRPTEAMQAAMLQAMRDPQLGDDTLAGDPVVRELELVAAALAGKEDGLLVSSGIMGNLVATLSHAPAGGEIVVDAQSHMARSEMGGMSRLAGLYAIPIASADGKMELNLLQAALRADYDRSGTPTALVCLESSHNHSGGCVPGLDYLHSVARMAADKGIAVHLDGARVFNAAISLGVPLRDIACHVDSLMLCLSKGLSAPMGSLLLGSREFIARARVFRRMVGGGLRQSGIIAAAGLVALNTMVERLADDHRNARLLWEGWRGIDPALVDTTPPASNIVHLRVQRTVLPLAVDWQARLEQQGVMMLATGHHHLRAVLHRHIRESDIPEAVAAVRRISESA